MPIFSVIIPTYNRKEKLKKAIESVLNQTFSNFEILVCDDGSTDGSNEILNYFDDPRIKWLPGNRSGGPAIPRNRGIYTSKGEWLAFLDSDDIWLPNKLERQIEIIQNYQNIRAICSNSKIMKNDIILEKNYFDFTNDQIFNFDKLMECNYIITSSLVIHKSLAIKMKGFPENNIFVSVEDYVLWLSCSMLTDIYYINEPLLIYRDEPNDSIRGIYQDNELKRKLKILREVYRRAEYVDNSDSKKTIKRKIIKQLIKTYIKYYNSKFMEYIRLRNEI